jgi:hypothetical protein
VKAVKRLLTIAEILLRELQRKLPAEILKQQEEYFASYQQVLAQRKHDKDKIYSLHEPQVYCVAKGKDHKPYEYGAKASLVTTAQGGIILSAVSHATNEWMTTAKVIYFKADRLQIFNDNDNAFYNNSDVFNARSKCFPVLNDRQKKINHFIGVFYTDISVPYMRSR